MPPLPRQLRGTRAAGGPPFSPSNIRVGRRWGASSEGVSVFQYATEYCAYGPDRRRRPGLGAPYLRGIAVRWTRIQVRPSWLGPRHLQRARPQPSTQGFFEFILQGDPLLTKSFHLLVMKGVPCHSLHSSQARRERLQATLDKMMAKGKKENEESEAVSLGVEGTKGVMLIQRNFLRNLSPRKET